MWYNAFMEEQLQTIKKWLGTGSINIFGLPMSGKDTVGVRLAEALNGKFLSSGLIVRALEKSTNQDITGNGKLMPQNLFYDWVLPYFEKKELWEYPLILSSIGRWNGEEDQVMSVARSSGHPIKAVVMLQLSEQDAIERWEAAKLLNDRGLRADDANPEIFQTRINEFREKTVPVLRHYQELGLLVPVKADAPRDQVFANVIEALASFASRAGNFATEL
jgi:adenylate kinase